MQTKTLLFFIKPPDTVLHRVDMISTDGLTWKFKILKRDNISGRFDKLYEFDTWLDFYLWNRVGLLTKDQMQAVSNAATEIMYNEMAKKALQMCKVNKVMEI